MKNLYEQWRDAQAIERETAGRVQFNNERITVRPAAGGGVYISTDYKNSEGDELVIDVQDVRAVCEHIAKLYGWELK